MEAIKILMVLTVCLPILIICYFGYKSDCGGGIPKPPIKEIK
jgi:hypothetical protein